MNQAIEAIQSIGGESECGALIFGLNYSNSPSELAGCVNDANNYRKVLQSRGFKDITLLTNEQCTRYAMMKALGAFCIEAHVKKWKKACITYSGHGGQVKAKNDPLEADGQNETLVPIDYLTSGMIEDDEVHAILKNFPQETELLLVSDSCHSGSIADLPINYPFDHFNTPISVKGYEMPNNIVCISGCRDEQYSSDISATRDAPAAGALTRTLLTTLHDFDYKISYHALMLELNMRLEQGGFQQVATLSSTKLLTAVSIFTL